MTLTDISHRNLLLNNSLRPKYFTKKGKNGVFYIVVLVLCVQCEALRLPPLAFLATLRHLCSIQGLEAQCCIDPDLWRAGKLDPARELNKRISWHSTDWRTCKAGQIARALGCAQIKLWYLRNASASTETTGNIVCVRRDSFHSDGCAELSSLLFESTFLHTYLWNMRQVYYYSCQNTHWCGNTIQVMV